MSFNNVFFSFQFKLPFTFERYLVYSGSGIDAMCLFDSSNGWWLLQLTMHIKQLKIKTLVDFNMKQADVYPTAQNYRWVILLRKGCIKLPQHRYQRKTRTKSLRIHSYGGVESIARLLA